MGQSRHKFWSRGQALTMWKSRVEGKSLVLSTLIHYLPQGMCHLHGALFQRRGHRETQIFWGSLHCLCMHTCRRVCTCVRRVQRPSPSGTCCSGGTLFLCVFASETEAFPGLELAKWARLVGQRGLRIHLPLPLQC